MEASGSDCTPQDTRLRPGAGGVTQAREGADAAGQPGRRPPRGLGHSPAWGRDHRKRPGSVLPADALRSMTGGGAIVATTSKNE